MTDTCAEEMVPPKASKSGIGKKRGNYVPWSVLGRTDGFGAGHHALAAAVNGSDRSALGCRRLLSLGHLSGHRPRLPNSERARLA